MASTLKEKTIVEQVRTVLKTANGQPVQLGSVMIQPRGGTVLIYPAEQSTTEPESEAANDGEPTP